MLNNNFKLPSNDILLKIQGIALDIIYFLLMENHCNKSKYN